MITSYSRNRHTHLLFHGKNNHCCQNLHPLTHGNLLSLNRAAMRQSHAPQSSRNQEYTANPFGEGRPAPTPSANQGPHGRSWTTANSEGSAITLPEALQRANSLAARPEELATIRESTPPPLVHVLRDFEQRAVRELFPTYGLFQRLSLAELQQVRECTTSEHERRSRAQRRATTTPGTAPRE